MFDNPIFVDARLPSLQADTVVSVDACPRLCLARHPTPSQPNSFEDENVDCARPTVSVLLEVRGAAGVARFERDVLERVIERAISSSSQQSKV